MRFIDDLYDIFTLSRRGQRFLSALFWTSLVMDLDLAVAPMLVGDRVLSHHISNPALHFTVASIELAIAVATMLFWFLMFKFCLRAKVGILRSSFWILAFVVGTCVTAQIYYLLAFRRSLAFGNSAVPLQ